MSDQQIMIEKEKRRQTQESRRREHYKKMFGVYPKETWR
jgi:hypothetical protein